jgi:DNA-binding CsgD family transcriptional regulator/predicted enzyme related to lactoylglutathione lyase
MSIKGRGRPPHPDQLTPAEWRVFHAAQHGMSNRVMAAAMHVSVAAIKYHLRNILGKLGLDGKKALKLLTRVPATSALALDKTTANTDGSDTMQLQMIGQIARTVGNIDVAQNWYELVLELPHLYRFGPLSFFECNGTRLMLTQQEKLNPDESVLYFKVADILQTHKNLLQKGVEFIAAPHRIHQHSDGTEEWMAFFKDPDGRTLALMTQIKPG